MTERLRAHCDHWIDIRQLGIQETVELMRGHELDIVVSISSPADKCLTILASRVAPIQMIWLVFASCTSGLANG